jgi:hypothetical protein
MSVWKSKNLTFSSTLNWIEFVYWPFFSLLRYQGPCLKYKLSSFGPNWKFQGSLEWSKNTVILVRPETGESAQLSSQNFWAIFFFRISSNVPAKNSPKLAKFRPKFFGPKFDCADSPSSNKSRPNKNYCAQAPVVYTPIRPKSQIFNIRHDGTQSIRYSMLFLDNRLVQWLTQPTVTPKMLNRISYLF